MAQGQVMEAIVNLAGSVDPSLGRAVESAQKKISGINVKAAAVGAAVGGIAVATGKAVLEAGKYLKQLGSEFDSAADAIRIGTGATGEALDGLLEDFDEVYKSLPTTMEDASKAVADYNTRLGLTGPVLQDISKQAIQVSDMLGNDLGGVIESSSKAFQQWNIDADNMGDAMDYIFKVSQSTGMGFTDLMTDVQKFGPQLQEMGYSFETASALMGQLDKAGVNTEEVLGALKKSVGVLAKEGISASDGFAMYYEKIMDAGSAAEAASIASEIFGVKAGSTMAAAIRDGTLAVGDLTASLLESDETIAGAAEDTYDFSERLQMMKHGLEVALKPMANTIFDGLNKMMPVLQKLMEKIVPVISDAVDAAMPFVEDFLMGAADALEGVIPLIVQLAADLFPILTKLLSSLLPPLLKLVRTIIPPLVEIVAAILPPIRELLTSILPIITEIVAYVLPVLASLISELLPLITPLLQMAIQLVYEVVMPLLPMLMEIISAILPVLTQLLAAIIPVFAPLLELAFQLINDFIMPVLPPIIQLVESLLPPIVTIMEAVMSLLTPILQLLTPILSMLSPILQILTPILQVLGPIAEVLGVVVGWIAKVVDWVLGGLGWVVRLFTGQAVVGEDPKGYAAGGFTDGLGIVGEDPRYPTEAVISFNPAYRDENLAYWARAGQMLGATNDDESDYELLNGGAGDTSIVYDLSGLSFSPQITIQGDANEDDLIKQLKDLEPEFIDYVLEALARREAGAYVKADNRIY